MIIGYGNPGRGDDGLGPAFMEIIENEVLQFRNNITFEESFQLAPEDAYKLSACDIVYFVDADMSDSNNSFTLNEVQPRELPPYTSHAITSEYLLHLCAEIFGKRPAAYKLAIRGYNWEFGEDLTSNAKQNLLLAMDFFTKKIQIDLSLLNNIQSET